ICRRKVTRRHASSSRGGFQKSKKAVACA
ncbi:uncharacterized protein METZ01_LOCUS473784, partial [marine metagenome]